MEYIVQDTTFFDSSIMCNTMFSKNNFLENIPETTTPDLRFAGLDLEYYKSCISPDQFQLLMKIIGIFP